MLPARGCRWLVVTSLLAPVTAQSSLQREVDAALHRARPAMLEMAQHTSRGIHALLCLAMAHDGLTMDDKAFSAAIDKLARARLAETYELSCRLMVMARLEDYPERRKAARADVKLLLENQRGGGFTYRATGGRWDLSNTQYAALGMRAGASLGAKIPKTAWKNLASTVLRSQVYRGGFGYRPKSGPTPSMTVAGIAVLEICRQHLNASAAYRKRLDKAVSTAWSYMTRHKASIGQGREQQRNYYFHYGLERAAILCDKERIDGVDWYAKGARMFVDQQSKDGAWSYFPKGIRLAKPLAKAWRMSQGPIHTSFAVLFLRRSFRKTLTGPITPKRAVLARFLPAQSDDKAIARSVRLEIARGYRAVPDLILAMRSPILARRKVAAKALPAITNKFREYSPYRTPEQSAELIKGAETWWLREGRKKLK